ncbi:transcriptional regulator [Thalassomonas viridans]|uniref:Transcriptional regulator n=1 Tax=Thalassomonas viridans TaxID=137584 RepID=A0AAE9YZ51_9GAMM|nr:helix-turn-helix transcriptional regulator [Thalassomonas viridans]WDE03866.1 transcriptional regulator [Thalassomonas viridans]
MKKNHQTALLGAKLKRHYEQSGVSQEELAKIFKTKQSWISRIYSGEFTKRSKVARKLCERADIPFLDGDSSKGIDDSKIYKIASELVELQKSDLNTISKLYGLLRKMQ